MPVIKRHPPQEDAHLWPESVEEAANDIFVAMSEGTNNSLENVAGYATIEEYLAAGESTLIPHIVFQTGMNRGNEKLLVQSFGEDYTLRRLNTFIPEPILDADGNHIADYQHEVEYDYATATAKKIATRVWERARSGYPNVERVVQCECGHTLLHRDLPEHHASFCEVRNGETQGVSNESQEDTAG